MIVPDSNQSSDKEKWTLKEIQAILFSVVGVFIFSIAIPRAFTWVSQLIALFSDEIQDMPYRNARTADTWISISLSLIQLATGIGLFFGAKNLSNMWHRFREWTPNKDISEHAIVHAPAERKAVKRRKRIR